MEEMGRHLRGHLHRTEIIGRSKIDLISQWSLRSNENISVWDHCALINPSSINPSGWKTVAFIERSLRDYWEIDEIIDCWMSVYWAFIEDLLRDHFPWWALRDCFGLSQNLRRPWWWWRSLDGHWQIIEITWRLLGALWKIVERSGHFFIPNDLSMITNPG